MSFWLAAGCYALAGLMVSGGVARALVEDPKEMDGDDLAPFLFICILVLVFWPLVLSVALIVAVFIACWYPSLLKEWWNKYHNTPAKVKKRDERRERREIKRQVNQVAKEYKVKRFRLIRR